MEYLPLLMLAPLTRLIVSDFRYREVSVMWLLILAVGTVCIPILSHGFTEILKRSGMNMLVLLYMLTGMTIWVWVKSRKMINPINRYIGSGDLIFFLTLVPLFPFRQYVYLLVSCSMLSLVWWLVATLIGRNPGNIPFIATSGIVTICAIVLKVFFE